MRPADDFSRDQTALHVDVRMPTDPFRKSKSKSGAAKLAADHCGGARSGDAGGAACWLLALVADGIRSSRCNTITIPAPQTTPTSHEIMMVFVSLHHIVASYPTRRVRSRRLW
jgi:hypothetical protein